MAEKDINKIKDSGSNLTDNISETSVIINSVGVTQLNPAFFI